MTMFWTMPEDDCLPAVTLCERHALEASNLGAPLFGFTEPFKTMQEAATMLDAMVATFGNGKVTSFNFQTSEIGHCDECHREMQAFHQGEAV